MTIVGKTYYFDAMFIGLNGMLRGTVVEDGDETGNYPNYMLMKGIYTNRDVWMSKQIITNKKTKEIKDEQH